MRAIDSIRKGNTRTVGKEEMGAETFFQNGIAENFPNLRK